MAKTRSTSRDATPLPPWKKLLFVTVMLLIPVLLLSTLELLLWAGGWGKGEDLFERPAKLRGEYLMPARTVAKRYFLNDPSPPTPSVNAFRVDKPKNSFRVFVMGESAAAGFPYSANAAFSEPLRLALQDVLPFDSVEVVNLAIAATSSFTVVDFADEVIAQHPDAVLIYAGHNEYYGALGVASTESLGRFPVLVRAYLELQRLRTIRLLLSGVVRITGASGGTRPAGHPASRMETIARDRRIVLGGVVYRRGVQQFESNLRNVVRRFSAAGVPVFLGSTPSNLRDLRPFGSAPMPSAAATYDSARIALSRGDTREAQRLYSLARDLDVVRFRAPSEFASVVKTVSGTTAASYVPVAERFNAAAKFGSPGSDLFLEHVHPTSHGQALIAREYFEAIRRRGFLGKKSDLTRLDTWDGYERRLALTELDHLIAGHVVRTITSRWPFVPSSAARDYRIEYRPKNYTDSLALAVSTGQLQWARAKMLLGDRLFSGGKAALAALEYRGMIGREPQSEIGYRLAGRALLAAGDVAGAAELIRVAHSIEPTAFSSYVLGTIAFQEKKLAEAASLLEQSLKLQPDMPRTLHQLSLTYALAGQFQRARALARRLSVVQPTYPGLSEWLAALGLNAH